MNSTTILITRAVEKSAPISCYTGHGRISTDNLTTRYARRGEISSAGIIVRADHSSPGDHATIMFDRGCVAYYLNAGELIPGVLSLISVFSGRRRVWWKLSRFFDF